MNRSFCVYDIYICVYCNVTPVLSILDIIYTTDSDFVGSKLDGFVQKNPIMAIVSINMFPIIDAIPKSF